MFAYASKSRREVFWKKAVLKHPAKFTEASGIGAFLLIFTIFS